MVAHAAGRLNAKRLLSLWGLPRSDSSRHPRIRWRLVHAPHFTICGEQSRCCGFPLLAKAAGWIGSIANQSRATLGGNLVNGSPAADSSPALLVYDAEIELASVHGKRRVPYAEFHTGYKRTVLEKDELVYAIHLPRRFAQHRQYLRKVGTRRAMAISKVALAANALIEDGSVREIRLAAASLAAFPRGSIVQKMQCAAVPCRRRSYELQGVLCLPK